MNKKEAFRHTIENMKKKIVFTGGGSAGHVMPNLALIEALQKDYDLYYIGTAGAEKSLLAPLRIPYGQIATPKFIRGLTVKNLTIPYRLLQGVKEAEAWLKVIRPNLVFSKGGYVSLPVVFAAKKLKIPALTHESDLSLGLANRLMAKKCRYVLTAFRETAEELPNGKYCGTPLRKDLFDNFPKNGKETFGFSGNKPVLLVLGGGSGSRTLNDAIRKNLFTLTEKYDILHLCGKGNELFCNVAGYVQKAFIPDMGAAYACSDLVVARAGANTVFETLALKKPTLFVPLQNKRSRGDQVKNAEYFQRRGFCHILYEKDISTLPAAIERLHEDEELPQRLKKCPVADGTEQILKTIRELV